MKITSDLVMEAKERGVSKRTIATMYELMDVQKEKEDFLVDIYLSEEYQNGK